MRKITVAISVADDDHEKALKWMDHIVTDAALEPWIITTETSDDVIN